MTATFRQPADDAPLDGAHMSVETVRVDRLRALVRVVGELDSTTTAPLWAVLRGHLFAGRRFVRLDLSGVTVLDASAVDGITRARHDLLRRRGSLIITAGADNREQLSAVSEWIVPEPPE